MRARPVHLSKVRVTGGPLKTAQDVTAKYLLELDPDRMMAFYRVRAGLAQKAQPYGGWDGGGRNLTGHIAGHHLSAVSLMYLATGDARFKTRADYLVRELKEVQDKNGDGYLSALEGGRDAWAAVSKGDIRSGGFDLNGLWSPWYTLHKTFAGLRDAYRHTGNRSALDVEVRFAGWAERVLAPLSDEQVQKMLNTEHGGMNEVLADLYADTNDKRWLDLSYRFEHRAFTDALKRHQDNLAGKHGNCQIPKLIGSAARYAYTGDTGDVLAASFFFDRVAQHHSYATGGHGLAEYFGLPDQLSGRVDGRTCESCNDYNMLKLTRRLFSFRPDASYADFHERALFNHVLASIDPQDGKTSYMVPVGRGVQQEYQNMQQSFTCCVGTGMESHALHGDGVYYESNDTIWVNLFVPSTAQFTLGRASLAMETGFPDGDSAKLALTLPSPKAFTLAIRRPSWAGDGFTVKVNGETIPQPTLASLRAGAAGGRNMGEDDRVLQPSSFVELKRTWKSGDIVELTLPKVGASRTNARQQDGDGDHVGSAGARRRSRSASRRTRVCDRRARAGARRGRSADRRLAPFCGTAWELSSESGGARCHRRRRRRWMSRWRRSIGRTGERTVSISTCSRRRSSTPAPPHLPPSANAFAASKRRRSASYNRARCSLSGTSIIGASRTIVRCSERMGVETAAARAGSRSIFPWIRRQRWRSSSPI